jgi:hypothetical protein
VSICQSSPLWFTPFTLRGHPDSMNWYIRPKFWYLCVPRRHFTAPSARFWYSESWGSSRVDRWEIGRFTRFLEGPNVHLLNVAAAFSGQDVLPCTYTDRIHPIPIDVFVRLVLSPIRRQKPSPVVDYGIWFFIKPDHFSCNVIRNCMNVLNSRSWVILKTVIFHQFPRRPLAGDTGLIWRQQNGRAWNRDHCVPCIHMLNTVIKKKLRSLSRFVARGYRSSNF